jgi:hypothetical protein
MNVGKEAKKTIKIQYKQLRDKKGERKGRKTENEEKKQSCCDFGLQR